MAGVGGPARGALIARSGALGDVLLLRRAVTTLARAGFRVHLLAPGAAGAALVGGGCSEAASCFRSERADLAVLWARHGDAPADLREALGPDGIAYVVSTDPDLSANLARLVSRIVTCAPAPGPGAHASDWLARPLGALGIEAAALVPSLEFSPEERAAAQPWLERLPARFLAIHPGSGSPRKNWPAERYAGLADALSPAEPFLVVAGPADDAAVLPSMRRPDAVRAAGLPPRTLGALLARARTFVGNDSGVTHLAAAAGTPTLALFGPTDPAQWAPVGTSVRVLRGRPIESLSVEDVARAAF
jgi:heptosyltransferase-2